MTRRNTASVSATIVGAALIGAVLAAAPAGAQPECREAGATMRCETNGSVQITTGPRSRAQTPAQQMPGMMMAPWQIYLDK
ncbi:hypothetical protein [Mycolicibacterium brumae]|uniref:hypothetical protein n=1 Tax=Mycolicibacterium brumae TaxID=85968 RepID=UPI000FE25F3B|nr:hypothetical protein [Mycolicibacterium brumae]MCV7191937.1 hypothetical protein [Mycolicibacterium brumae]UWW07706.1 hypothetical protein L2Z93_000733 [Mycolicibacterium brumae]